MIENPYLIFCIGLLLAVFGTADKFDTFDSNHDGKLDRSEYGALAKELRTSVEPFFVEPGAEGAPASSSHWDHLSGEDFVSGVFNSLVVIIGGWNWLV